MPIGGAHCLRRHDRLHVDPRTPWRHLRKDGTHVDVHTLPFTPEGLEIAFDITPGLRKAGYKTLLREDELCGFPVYTLLAFPPKRPNRKERGALL